MKCIVIPVGCDPAVIDVGMDDVANIIGGYVGCSGVADNLVAYYHDEGKMIGLQPNIITNTGAMIAGTIVLSRNDDGGDTIDTTHEDLLLAQRLVATSKRGFRFEYDLSDSIRIIEPEGDETLEQMQERAAKMPPPNEGPVGVTDIPRPRIDPKYAHQLAARVAKANPDEVAEIVAELEEVARG